jgi:hypothetical protein
LLAASRATIASGPELTVVLPDPSGRASLKAVRPAAATPAAASTRTIASVTSGPAIATFSSAEGLGDSRSIRATPPKIQSWMLEMPIPLRRATIACPSSCRRIEPKKPTALSRARPKGSGAELDSPSRLP